MNRGYKKAITGILIVAVIFVFYASFAFAYPSQGTQDQTTDTSLQVPSSFNLNWIGNAWNALSASFQGLINGIGSFFSGNTSNTIGTTVSNVSIGGANSQLTLGGAYQNFDNWLYGVAGFHVSEFFNAVVSIIVWLLNLTRNIINWALSLTH